MHKNKHLKITIALSFICWFSVNPTLAQSSTGEEIIESVRLRAEMRENSTLRNYPVRSIGPVVQGARIVDIAVEPSNIHTYYVAYASGGVFKTKNNGVSFRPVFDNQGALTIGDMALAPSDANILYVGTGEKNSSRSSYAGSGVYKSLDAGNTWTHLGLDNTQHISRVLVHPENPDIVWVASLGALYSKNEDRGVYKSTDGGKTWKKTLYLNDSTGVTDLTINESNPDQLIAATWERMRTAWDFKGSGPGSGIFRSVDGGETWSKSMEGFPELPTNGRIGVNYAQGSPDIVYAVMDSQVEMKEEKKDEQLGLKIKDFINMSKENLLGLDDQQLDEFLKKNNYPSKYNSKLVKKEISENKYAPRALAEYFGDANQALFDTKIAGAEVYRSDDGGKSWNKTNTYDLEGVYFTYGYYFGEVTVSPQNSDEIYVYGVPLLKSEDGGKTFARIDTIGNVHVDHQAMWVNPDNDDHVLLGNDGGLYVSYDGGAEWLHLNNDAVGQFYTVNVDMERPYNVYGGLQDNGTLVGSSQTVPGRSKNWEFIFGGDGMFVAPDPRNSDVVYTGFQFGNYYRMDRAADRSAYITPKHDIGEAKLRYNWRTPLILSKHNADILYIGAQKVYRSLDQGKSWDAISGDLTKDKPQGNVPFSTITCIAESPHKFGVLYVGTDDGNVQFSPDGGGSWELISSGLPADKWVSSISPSPHDEATVFVSFTGYRDDDFRTYLYVSEDYGKNWKSLQGNLPDESVNIVIQDPVNDDLLYVGTDHGTYISFDRGGHWEHLNQIPNVASYDMIIHPRENELVVATHGRSVYVLDVKPFQKLKGDAAGKGVVAFEPGAIMHSKSWGERRYPYLKPNLPTVALRYYVGKPSGKVGIQVYDDRKNLVRILEGEDAKGFHSFSWDLKVSDKPLSAKRKRAEPNLVYAQKGKYTIKFVNGDEVDEVDFEVK